MKLFTRYARFMRLGYKALHPGWRADTRGAPEGAAVYLIHHQNMFGPVHFLGLWPKENRMWSLHVFYNRALCFDQFYRYTFRERFGWHKLPAFCLAKLLSYIVPPVLRAFAVIPVYRGEANLLTVRASMDALLSGKSVSLCPDIAYASSDPAMGEIYTGFLMLGALYYKKTGQALPFVPVYISKRKRVILLGPPETMEMDASLPRAVRDEMGRRITAAVNRLGQACGDIVSKSQNRSV
ncbi:MAG: hypothetical protein FWF69_09085 [Firmicutes bacterium]|nr:hypothetical protein [Bacillota bacterium]